MGIIARWWSCFRTEHISSNLNETEDEEVRTIAKKKYELCASAATHITSIGKSAANIFLKTDLLIALCSLPLRRELRSQSFFGIPLLLRIHCQRHARHHS